MQSRLSVFCDKVLEAGWLAALVIVPLFFDVYSARVFEPDKLSLLRAVVLLMSVAWFIRLWESKPSGLAEVRANLRTLLLGNAINLFAALLLGVYVLSTLLSIVPVFSFWGSYQRLQGLLSVLAYIVLFFVVSQHLTRRAQLERLITVALVTSIPICLYGVLQHLGWDPLPWSGDVTARVTGTMGNAIFLAAYIIMVIPFALARFVTALREARAQRASNQRPAIQAALYGLLLLLQLVTTVLTQSRGPWLGILAGLAVFVLLFLLREQRRAQFWTALGVVAVGVLFIGLLNVPRSPIAGLKSASPYLERLGSLTETDSSTGKVRLLIWAGDGVGTGAFGLITADPFRTVFGYGPESMHIAYNKFYPPALAHVEARNASPDRSHDDYLDSAVTTGLLGLLVHLALLVTAVVITVRSLWRAQEFGVRVVLLAVLAAVVAHSVEVAVGIAIAATRTYFWLDLAIVSSIAVGRLQWAPAPVPRATAASGSAPTSSSVQAKGKKGKLTSTRQSTNRTGRARESHDSSSGFMRYAFLVAYLGITFLLALWVVFGLGRQLEPPVTIIGTFVWIVIGILITAEQLDRPSIALSFGWRRKSWWLYGLVIAAAAFSTIFHILSPMVADVYFKRAQAYDDAGRKPQALSAYLSTVSWVSYQDFYFVFLGRLFLESAQAAPEKPESLQIASVDDLFNMPRLDQIGRDDLFRASLVTLTRARDLSPLSTDNYANLARLYGTWAEMTSDAAKKKELYDTAGSYYQQATQLSPNLAYLYEEWAGAYMAEGRNEEAGQLLNRSVALDDQYAPAYVRLGDLARGANDVPKAEEYYNKALAIAGNLPTAYIGLGYALYQQGNTTDALDAMLKAVRYAPQDPLVHRALAIMYRDSNMPDKAISEVQAALRYAAPAQQPELKSLLDELQKPK